MNLKKPLAVIITFFLVLGAFTLTIPLSYASPKSLYLIANHSTKQFDTWNINPDGTATYQFKVTLQYAYAPADIAIDESSNTLFITSEGTSSGAMVEIVDATTMTLLGMVTGPSGNCAGIEADDANDVVYVMRRGHTYRELYAFDWDSSASTLALKAGYPVTLTAGGYGIALDETTGILWVADAVSPGKARAYDITTWSEDTGKSFSPIHQPVDIAVDRQRGFVYTVSMTAGAAVPYGCGSNFLSKYEIATKTETKVDMASALGVETYHGVGVAVDEVTGYVYVTGRYSLTVWDTSTSPFTLLQTSSLSGSPAGICIPQEEVAYNPLGLSKDDGLAGAFVNPGGTITYTITYDNSPNTYDVDSVVLTDDLPAETTFSSATGGGTYDSATHTVTWNIGTITAGSGPFSETLSVTVDPSTPQGTTITNYATIDSDQTPPTTVSESTDVYTVGLAPTIESCDSTGTKKDRFYPGETVYVYGSGYLVPDAAISYPHDLYVVEDVATWIDGMSIPSRVSGTATSVSSDSSGNIPVAPVWGSSLVPGKYDIVVDVDGDGVYDADTDALDDSDIQVYAGFLVVPEYPLGTIVGLFACFAALAVFIRSKRYRLPLFN